MAQPLHKYQTDNHRPHAWEYANAAARTGASGFTSSDLGKWAKQVDTGAYYELTATTPTWVQKTGGAVAASAVSNTPAGTIASTDVQAAINELDGDITTLSSATTTALAGKAATSHSHAASDITSGTIATSRLGSGTADNTTFLRGDQTYAVPAGGGSLVVQEGDSTVTSAATTLDFGSGFDVTESPAGEANIALDLTEYSGGALPIAGGGSGQTTATAAFDALDPTTTKGDLIVNDGTNAVRLAVGTNFYRFVADSAETKGVKWVSALNCWEVFTDFQHPVSATTPGEFVQASGNSGSVAAGTGTADAIGVAILRTSTNASARIAYTTAATHMLFGGGRAYYWTRISLSNLSDATDRFTIRAGFLDSVSGDGTDGVFFRYCDNVNSGNWECVCRNNSSEASSTINTSTAPVTSGWQRLRIEVNAAGTSVEFFIDGTSQGTITANIPTSTGRETGVGISHIRSVGTTARDLNVDYIRGYADLTTTRV